VALVLETMPELLELCGDGASDVAGLIRAIDNCHGTLTTAAKALPAAHFRGPWRWDFGYVVSSSEEVDEARVLARNFDALFTKEHRNLLVSLEATNTRYGKKIACVLGRGRLRRV
jgi:hypothetical protein